MRIPPSNSGRTSEKGIIITLVAIFMLFVVGAMAALSIDVVTFYTARSEAQIAADSAALAAARVLANSGLTSSGGGTITNPFPIDTTTALATNIATQIARQNPIGGSTPQVTVTPSLANLSDPRVTVKVTATLPTFFARIWGTTTVGVSATATAEAYNPSGLATNGSNAGQAAPVAASCVKPWLLPNIDPSPTATANGYIFDPASGQIQDPSLLGWYSPSPPADLTSLHAGCAAGDCSGGFPSNLYSWQYLPADPGTFVPPSSSSVSCFGSGFFTSYQYSVAGCVQTPIACNQSVAIDSSSYGPNRDLDTSLAVDCLTHHPGPVGDDGSGDSVNLNNSPLYPFEFLAGEEYNSLVQAGILNPQTPVLTSDSLVTVPVFDSRTLASPVQVIGFVQLFLQPSGSHVEGPGGPAAYKIRTMVINMVGCGTNATGTPVYGNGPSAVPVRLIATPTAN